MLRVGFDGRALASPAAGVRRYTHQLFGALASLSDVEIVAVGVPAATPTPPGVRRAAGAASLPTNPGWMLTGLPTAARRAGIDLFHAPAYTAPYNAPRPLVLTIHDVSYARHPEWYPHKRDPLRRAYYRWSARSADRVITDSSFSKSEIVLAYGLPPDTIDVVPLAASDALTEASDPPSSGVAARYLLHVGDLHPRRNLEMVARAILRVRQRVTALTGVQLVLVGVDRGTEAGLARFSASPGGGDLISRPGDVDDARLAALYRGAAALVYPSRYEGFGLPLVEAMSCGTPIIASRAASIPEVTGDAAILLDPDDEAGWADAIEAVLTIESGTAQRLREAGRRRATSFSWRLAAAATLAVYRRALGGGA